MVLPSYGRLKLKNQHGHNTKCDKNSLSCTKLVLVNIFFDFLTECVFRRHQKTHGYQLSAVQPEDYFNLFKTCLMLFCRRTDSYRELYIAVLKTTAFLPWFQDALILSKSGQYFLRWISNLLRPFWTTRAALKANMKTVFMANTKLKTASVYSIAYRLQFKCGATHVSIFWKVMEF